MRDVTPDDLLPPVGHSALWPILGGVAVIVAIAVVTWAFWPRRARTVVESAAPVTPDTRTARERFLARVDELERAYRQRTIDDRQLHLDLSAAMRGYAAEIGVIAMAEAMTPAALRAAGASQLADAVLANYPPQFQAESASDAKRALATAREVAA